MDRRGQERDLDIPNSLTYTSPVIQESPLKLPLAPILSTPTDRRVNPAVSGRRGTSIFSPVQTLDPPENQNLPHHHHHHQRQLSPPPLQHPVAQREPSPDSPPPPAPPPQAAAEPIRYRECLKNHAANMGGHVVDGCGEFMPGGDDGTPESLRCAACDCHRNFHRKEVEGEPQYSHPYAYNHPIQRPPLLHAAGQANYSAPPHRHPQHHKHSHSHGAPPTMFNFGSGGAAAESSSEDLNMFGQSSGGHAVLQPSHSRKRFRTKFSQDQKDRMQEFAARIGWRIQKQDEEEVQRFCAEVGVKRQVFKVWMHNNKQAMKRRQN